MNVNFQCEKRDWDFFQQQVGYGNASITMRNFILSYGEKAEPNEKRTRKEFEIVNDEYMKMKAKWQRLKEKIEVIDDKKKQEELIRIKKEDDFKKKMQDIEYRTKAKDLHRVVMQGGR